MVKNQEAIQILDEILGKELNQVKELARKECTAYGAPENYEFWGFMLEAVGTNLVNGIKLMKESIEDTGLMVYAVLDHLRYGTRLELAQGILNGDYDPAAGAPLPVWYAVFLNYRGFDIPLNGTRAFIYGKDHTGIPEFSDWEDLFIEYGYEYPTQKRGLWREDLVKVHRIGTPKHTIVGKLSYQLEELTIATGENEQSVRVAGIDHYENQKGGFDVILIKCPVGTTPDQVLGVSLIFKALEEKHQVMRTVIDSSQVLTKGYIYGYIYW